MPAALPIIAGVGKVVTAVTSIGQAIAGKVEGAVGSVIQSVSPVVSKVANAVRTVDSIRNAVDFASKGNIVQAYQSLQDVKDPINPRQLEAVRRDSIDHLLASAGITNQKARSRLRDEIARYSDPARFYAQQKEFVIRNGALVPVEHGYTAYDNVVQPVQNLPYQYAANPAGFATSIESMVGDKISGIYETVSEYVKGTVSKVTDTIDGIMNKADTLFADLAGNALDSIERVVSTTLTLLTTSFDKFTGAAGLLISNISDEASAVFEKVASSIGDIVQAVVEFIERMYSTAADAIESAIQNVSSLADEIQQGFSRLIDETIGAASALAGRVSDTISDIPSALMEMSADLASKVGEALGDATDAFAQGLHNTVMGLFDMFKSEDVDAQTKAIEAALLGQTVSEKQRSEFLELFGSLQGNHPIALWFINLFMGVGVLMKLYGGMADAQANVILQEYGRVAPYKQLPPAESIAALRRGYLTLEETTANIQRDGFSIHDAVRIVKVSEKLPPEEETLRWTLRGLIPYDECDRILKGQGYTDIHVEAFKKAAFFIPPPADLITMAVREAFSPEVAEKFGQYEDFPPDFAQYASQIGINEEWARRYWASHWGLPSVQMGYEMLHRRVIDRDTLKLLMRAQDIMPYWRDKLIAISYSPYTRVDVRRMHAVGVLTRDQVKEAYLDLGYDDEKAENLTDFTERLNNDPTTDNGEELGALTRAAVLNFYDDGIIDRRRAQELLLTIGMSVDAALLYLDAIDYDDQRKERKETIVLILDMTAAGLYTFDEAQDQLTGLGIEEKELERAMLELVRIQQRKTKLPTRSDLDRMLRADLITQQEYLQNMSRLGYSELWANRYMQLVIGG